MPAGIALCSWNEKEGLNTHFYFPSTLKIPTVLVSELLTSEEENKETVKIIQSGLSELKGLAIPIDLETNLYLILFLNNDESPETYRKSFLKEFEGIPKKYLSLHAIERKSNQEKIKQIIEEIFWDLTSLENDAVLAQKLYDEIFSNSLQFVQILTGITVEGSELVYGVHITNHSGMKIEQITFQLDLPEGIIRADPKFNPNDADLQKLDPNETHVFMFNLRYRGMPLGTIKGYVSLKMTDGIYVFELPPARLSAYNLIEYPQNEIEPDYTNISYNFLITDSTDISRIIEGLILRLDTEIVDEVHAKHENLNVDMWILQGNCAYGFSVEIGIFAFTDMNKTISLIQVAGGSYEFNRSIGSDIINAIRAAAALDAKSILSSEERFVDNLSMILILYLYVQIINNLPPEELIVKLKDITHKLRALKLIALEDPKYENFILAPTEPIKQNIELIIREIWRYSYETNEEINFIDYLEKISTILKISDKAYSSLREVFE